MYCVWYINRYGVMRECWEMAPEDRPTFKELYTTISKYVEHMAGYLDMVFNPFTAGGVAESGEGGGDECGTEVETILEQMS